MAELKAISEIIKEISPYYQEKGEPEAQHKLVYDSSSEMLEPIYFFILDLMNDFKLAPEKLVDNFTSAPGSGHFAELGQRATIMQQQGDQTLKTIYTILRSVLQILYDLRDFRMRLQSYDDLKDKKKEESATLALKQIWMDKVDMQKGNSSIKAMALSQAGFVTLIDAFLAAKSPEDVNNIDLNDIVKRILKPRLQEFYIWLKESEIELRKRYEIQKNYLKSQVNSMKIYSRWVKPYLRAAQQLEMKDAGRNPNLISIFNTILLELTLLGKNELSIDSLALEGKLPRDFHDEKFIKKLKRKYYSCVLVDFNFRGIPQKVGQHYILGGKSEITFKAYALNNEELEKLSREIDKSDIGEVLKLLEGTTTESLGQIQKEIDYYLEGKEMTEEEAKKEPSKDSSNPFLALIGHYERKEKKEEEAKKTPEELDKPIKSDNWIERENLRPAVAAAAKGTIFKLFEIYKKAHGMPAFDFYQP